MGELILAISFYLTVKIVIFVAKKRQEVEEEKVETTRQDGDSYVCQLNFVIHKLDSLYQKKKDWDVYDNYGIYDASGNKCKKEDCIEYLKIERDIEILENKKRRLESKCN